MKGIQSFSLLIAFTFLLLFHSSTAQTKLDYGARWREIDSLITKKGLTQSALTEVNKLLLTARNEKNDAQLIKALIYRMGLQQNLREDAVIDNIQLLEREINENKEPARSILKSSLAEIFWNYFQQHRWKLYDRTPTTKFKKQDITTWDIADFHTKITGLYLESIEQEALLKKVSLEAYDPVIIKGNARYLRPTLFDLLAHRALDYFGNDERYLSQPAYSFEIDDPVAFEDARIFASHKFHTNDTTSLHYTALQLFQRLLKFHIPDNSRAALIDLDIERIEFVNRNAVMDNKDGLYLTALQRIADAHWPAKEAAQALYLIAEFHASHARQYDPLKDTSNRYEYLSAISICEKVLIHSDSSEGRANCQLLRQEILQKVIRLKTECVNVPDQPFRTLVTYRNLSQLYFRLYKIGSREVPTYSPWNDDYWMTVLALPLKRSFSRQLPETNDRQPHNVEIKIDALPAGRYVLVASASNDFSIHNNPLSVEQFQVSGLSFINNGADYFVLNRENGQPVAKAQVIVFQETYDATTRKQTITKKKELLTDQNGYVRLQPDSLATTGYINIEIRKELDTLVPDENIYNPDGDEDDDKEGDEDNQQKTYLFTDRSIYRPGQVVYFKGIVVTGDVKTSNSKVVKGAKSRVYLRNANNNTIDSLQVTTNDYGSFSGKFTLSLNQLTGQFSIESGHSEGEVEFSVEEYKRPKFFVEFENQKGAYRLFDTISVSGNAKAFAGNNVDGAKVRYRVVRTARFPYPWLLWKRGWTSSQQQEISSGEISTDAQGRFTIRFAALPDKKIAKESEPVFTFTVTTDVTDISGETRTAETALSVGYKALQLSITAPQESVIADSLKEIVVNTVNQAGTFEPSYLNITFWKLDPPHRLIRQRSWTQPDQFSMDREEYIQLFPHDEYNDETRKQNWKRLEKSFEFADSSRQNGKLPLGKTLLPGWYAIEVMTKDKYGDTVKDIKYVELTTAEGEPQAPAYVWKDASVEYGEPGSTAMGWMGTSADGLFVISKRSRTQESRDTAFSYTAFTTGRGKKSIPLSFSETDRGGFSITYVFVKHNRVFTSTNHFVVPWTNKELKITYETYRNRTLPGSNETWKLRITGDKNENAAAEVLTAMYDASLDQFKNQEWRVPLLWPNNIRSISWTWDHNFGDCSSFDRLNNNNNNEQFFYRKEYDKLLPYGSGNQKMKMALQGRVMGVQLRGAVSDVAVMGFGKSTSPIAFADTIERQKEKIPMPQLQTRKNFNESAFFFPDLRTDSTGAVEFSFTMPDALTQWKWMTIAHTKDLAFGYAERTVVTQKELMLQPNLPRFLREGDHIELSTKIVNLADSEVTGQVELQLLDATSNQPVDGWFQNMYANQYFTAGAHASSLAQFSIQVPHQFNKPVIVRMIARAGNISDGEENVLPVLTNQVLVTESLPLNMKANGTKPFRFDKLIESGRSETLHQHALTVEFTSNPAWYAVQALPYLMEFPHECAEQQWNRFFANALASNIVNASPRIKQVFEKWKNADTAALTSNLQKNQELKSVLIQETPWVLEAKNESEQKKRMALLFDMVRMSSELEKNLDQVIHLQLSNGGFGWFKGGPDDRYITQYILSAIGHLRMLHAIPASLKSKINQITAAAIPYLDQRIKEDYDKLVKSKADMSRQEPGYFAIQYLYMRSFFNDINVAGNVFQAYNFYHNQSQLFWVRQNPYLQGMIALALFRTGDGKTAFEILRSLKQNAITGDESGMYWKSLPGGYYWHQAPIEAQSLLIEAFSTISKDQRTVDALKTWLLRNKQTNNWLSTKATAEACYALLLSGTNWLSNSPDVKINLGDKVVTGSVHAEAGTGYFRKSFEGPFVNPSMGNITVTVSNPSSANTSPAWGAVYWQYFEQADRITAAGSALHLSRKLFIERNTERGPVLEPIGENARIKVGDKVKVRIELKADRDLEYVHMKDMRAAAFEPVNVLSSYKWQGGLGYYESTKDAATHFFFNYLPKGSYVFEYSLFAGQAGRFSNDITSIECMYAPEFKSHSEGIVINVDAQ